MNRHINARMAAAASAVAILALLGGLSADGRPAGPGTAAEPVPEDRPETPAAVPPPKPLAGVTIALLGDSLAAGEGGGSYLTGTDEPRQRCHRSAAGLFAATGADVFNLACSRATTRHLTRPQQDPYFNERAEPPQLSALPAASVHATVVMVGGNDIRFAEIFSRCILADQDCTADPGFTSRAIDTARDLVPALEEAYRKVAAAGDGRVLVPAYPQMFGEPGADCGRIGPAEARFARELTATLNGSIQQGAENAAAAFPKISYIGATEHALSGKGACDPEPLVHTVLPTALMGAAKESSRGQELLHPTAAGYRRLTEVLAGWLDGPPA